MGNDNDGPAAIAAERQRSQRHVQLTMAAMALGFLFCALAVHVLADRLGIPAETARLIASSFLLVATIDTVVLLYWERLFPAPR